MVSFYSTFYICLKKIKVNSVSHVKNITNDVLLPLNILRTYNSNYFTCFKSDTVVFQTNKNIKPSFFILLI